MKKIIASNKRKEKGKYFCIVSCLCCFKSYKIKYTKDIYVCLNCGFSAVPEYHTKDKIKSFKKELENQKAQLVIAVSQTCQGRMSPDAPFKSYVRLEKVCNYLSDLLLKKK